MRSGAWKEKNLQRQVNYGGAQSFSGPVQGDAAAKDEEDGVLRGGGGARVTESRERKRTKETGENEKRQFDPIYKEKADKWAQKTRRPKHGYPAVRAPRFSGQVLKIKIR